MRCAGLGSGVRRDAARSLSYACGTSCGAWMCGACGLGLVHVCEGPDAASCTVTHCMSSPRAVLWVGTGLRAGVGAGGGCGLALYGRQSPKPQALCGHTTWIVMQSVGKRSSIWCCGDYTCRP